MTFDTTFGGARNLTPASPQLAPLPLPVLHLPHPLETDLFLRNLGYGYSSRPSTRNQRALFSHAPRTTRCARAPAAGRGSPNDDPAQTQRFLLALSVGAKQLSIVDSLVSKFDLRDFVIVLFHYDGRLDAWNELPWASKAIHASNGDSRLNGTPLFVHAAVHHAACITQCTTLASPVPRCADRHPLHMQVCVAKQSKWWFARRFLHPSVVGHFELVFVWDEDIGGEHFDAAR